MKIMFLNDTHCGFGQKTYRKLNKFFDSISKVDCDVIVHAGDWISHSQRQWKSIFRLIRTYFPKKKVLGVLGNHDFWNDKKRFTSFETYLKEVMEIWNENNIMYLPDSPIQIENVEFYGFDGWHRQMNPTTNDSDNIRINCLSSIHNLLSKRSDEQFGKIMDYDLSSNNLKIIVTHFNLWGVYKKDKTISGNLQLKRLIEENFDIIIEGHTHQELNFKSDKIWAVSTASGYDKPAYGLIDTDIL